jgi:hypothetical protein
MSGTTIEAIRASYRPQRITTLFVGESAPVSGKFFYIGNTPLARYVERAMNKAGLGGGDNFLDRFKCYGWYLDDLVLNPVNQLTPPQRDTLCWEARESLAERIVAYRPEAIVSLLTRITPIVESAARIANVEAQVVGVPFPGQGHQVRFLEKMVPMIRTLPRIWP